MNKLHAKSLEQSHGILRPSYLVLRLYLLRAAWFASSLGRLSTFGTYISVHVQREDAKDVHQPG